MHRGDKAKCVASAARRRGALGVLGVPGVLGVHDSLIFIPDIKKRLFLLYVRTE